MLDEATLFAAGSQVLSHIVVGLDIHRLHLVVLLVLELDEVAVFVLSLQLLFCFLIIVFFIFAISFSCLHVDLASRRCCQRSSFGQRVQPVQRLQGLGNLVIGEQGVLLQGHKLLLVLGQASLSKKHTSSYQGMDPGTNLRLQLLLLGGLAAQVGVEGFPRGSLT